MKKQLLFYLTGGILLLQSCGGAPSKRVQVQNNDTISQTEIKTDAIIHDTTNFKTMKSQEKYSIIKRFDIARYNKNKSRDGLNVGIYEFSDLNGMLVKQEHSISESDGEYYLDERHYPNSAYTYTCMYNARGYITLYLVRFYDMIIGKIIDYDTSGNISKEIDEDAPYQFSIDDLILKMKREYDIDIENVEKIRSVVRSKVSVFDFPLYEVDYFIKQDTYCRCYLINGNTGKTLYISERVAVESDMDDCVESLVDEYKRVKKIK